MWVRRRQDVVGLASGPRDGFGPVTRGYAGGVRGEQQHWYGCEGLRRATSVTKAMAGTITEAERRMDCGTGFLAPARARCCLTSLRCHGDALPFFCICLEADSGTAHTALPICPGRRLGLALFYHAALRYAMADIRIGWLAAQEPSSPLFLLSVREFRQRAVPRERHTRLRCRSCARPAARHRSPARPRSSTEGRRR